MLLHYYGGLHSAMVLPSPSLPLTIRLLIAIIEVSEPLIMLIYVHEKITYKMVHLLKHTLTYITIMPVCTYIDTCKQSVYNTRSVFVSVLL